MIRVLSILAAVVALAVSAAPVSAGTSNTNTASVTCHVVRPDSGGCSGGYVANHTEGTVSVRRWYEDFIISG